MHDLCIAAGEVHRPHFAGIAELDGPFAARWTGTPDSYQDLHALLGPSFTQSEARAVWSDAAHVYIVGFGFNATTARNEAIMWVGPLESTLPACPVDFNDDGAVNSTDVSDFINAWFADQVNGTLITDWDANGVINSTDVSLYINDWFNAVAGGCP